VIRLALLVLLAGCATSCLVEGTWVGTPDGGQAVEDLRPGDTVTCREGIGVVTASRRAQAEEHLELSLADGRVLRVTAAHPLAVGGGWRRAGRLRPGDAVVGGRIAAVRAVRRPVAVYDLAVAPHANFFAQGVLVHNKKFATPPERRDLFGVWIGSGTGVGCTLLDLQPDGTGRYVQASGGDTFVANVVAWSLEGFELEVKLDAAGAALKGSADAQLLYLEWHEGGRKYAGAYEFQPLRAWREMQRQAAAALPTK
jgi:hypothetical protein